MKKKKNPNLSRCIKIEGQKKYQKILNNKIESKQWMKQQGTEKKGKKKIQKTHKMNTGAT